MRTEKARALVVRGTDWSETSRITTLFTREFGRIRALAKGGRRLKSSFDVAFDLLTVCDVVYIRKAGGLDLLTEARMNEQFPLLRRDLPALYAGYYVAELLADGTSDYDPHPALFDAALETLRGLGEGRDSEVTSRASREPTPPAPLPEGKGEKDVHSQPLAGPETAPSSPASRSGAHSPLPFREGGVGSPAAAAVSAFELVWLHELGYSPRLDACATCGRERLNPTARAFFSPSAGGVLCPECGPTVLDRRMVSGDALDAIRRLGEGEPPDLPDGCRAEVRQVLGYAVSCVLGRRPRLLGYVDGR